MTSHVLCSHCQSKVSLRDIHPDDETCPHCEKIVTLTGNGTLSGSGTLNAHGTLSAGHHSSSKSQQIADAATEMLWDQPSAMSGSAPKSEVVGHGELGAGKQQQVRDLCRAILKINPMFAPHIDTVLERGEKLGEGGMGAVYRVKDRRLGRDAALKILSNEEPDAAMIQRFMREAKITARLDHPRVPPIYDAGMGQDGHFLLMRLIAGQTMKQLIQELHSGENQPRASDFRPLLEALHKVSETVAYAHNRGILHRDLKPENIMIGAFGEVMVMDWGLARDLSEDTGHDSLFRSQVAKLSSDEHFTDEAVTQAGAIIGTPGYMSPEQAGGTEINELTDVFALGAILTDILSGQAPVTGKTLLKKVMNTLNGVWSFPRDRSKTAPKELNDLAKAALTLAPADRIACADDFAQELHAYLTGEELKVHHYSPLERSQRWIRKNPGYVLALSLATVFIAVAAIFAAQLQRSENARLDALRISAENRKQLLEEETARWSAEQRAKRKSWQAAQAEKQAAQARKVIKFFTKARDAARRRAPVGEITKLVNEALSASQQSFPALLTAAEIYRDGQLTAKAKEILIQAAENFSPAYEALFMLHTIENKQKRTRSGFRLTPALRQIVKRAAERNEVNQFVLFAQGATFADSGKFEDAIKCYNSVEQFSTGIPELYFLRGNAKLELGQIKAAIKDYSRAIELNPQLPLPWNNRGFAKFLLDQPKLSISDFDQAIALDSSSAQFYFNRGLSYSELNNNKAALDNFLRSLELDNEDTTIHANIGLTYTRLFQFKEALAVLNLGLKLTPKLSRLYQLRATVHLLAHNPKAAIKDLSFALTLTKDKTRLLVTRGQAWSTLKNWDKAFADFDAALKTNNADPIVYSNRGAAWTRRGDYDKALQDLKRAEDLDPKIAQIYLNRGVVHGHLKNYEEAIRCYSQSITLENANFEAYYNRATSYHRLKQYDKAALDYDKAVTLNANSSELFFNRGNNCLAVEDWKGAIDNYSRAISTNSKYVKAYFNRGVAWQRQRQFELARKNYEKAIKLDPKFSDAYFNRATMRAQIGDNPGAISDFSKVIELTPNNAPAYLSRGVQFARSNQFFAARKDYDQYIQMNPGNAAAHVNRGSTRSKLGMIRGAIEDWEKALLIDPNNPRAKQLRVGVKQLKDWIAANPGYSYEKHGKKEKKGS